MEIIDIINNIVGDTGRYEIILYVFITALVLICFDNIIKFLLASITSIFKGR